MAGSLPIFASLALLSMAAMPGSCGKAPETADARPAASSASATAEAAPAPAAASQKAAVAQGPAKPPRDAAIAKIKADKTMPKTPEHAMPGYPDPDPKPVMPGERVPGSTISVPGEVSAGTVLNGQVPAGSIVTVDGKRVTVSRKGRFSYAVPATRRGALAISVQRPGAAAAMELSSSIVAKK